MRARRATASVTGWNGGRAVVRPVVAGVVPVMPAWTRADRPWHILPWHGPIVTVL